MPLDTDSAPTTPDSKTSGLTQDRLWLLALLLVLGGIYAATLLPGVGFRGDIAKFQFIGPVLGTGHTTGYPTYMMLGWLWTHAVPFGSDALLMNALSALCMSASAGFVWGAQRELGLPAWAASLGALAWGTFPDVWSQAVVAEVYAMHALLLAAALWLVLRWGRTRTPWLLGASIAVVGLGFSHHLMMISALIPFLVYVLLTERRALLNPRLLPWLGLGLALATLPYAYIFWRTSDPDTLFLEMRANDLSELFYYLSGAQFRDQMFTKGAAALASDVVPGWALRIATNLGAALAFILIGALRPGWDRKTDALLAGIVLFQSGIVLNYAIGDIETYYLPIYLAASIYAGAGIHTLARVAQEKHPQAARAVQALALATVLSGIALSWAGADASGKSQDRIGETILSVTGPNALILTNSYHAACILHYFLLAEDREADGRAVILSPNPGDLVAWAAQTAPWRTKLRARDIPFGLRVFTLGPPQEMPSFKSLDYQSRHLTNNIYEVRGIEQPAIP